MAAKSKMIIRVSDAVFYLFCATVFLFAFEQITWVYFGVETILKPYRITLGLGLVLALFSKNRLGRDVVRITLAFTSVYVLGTTLALFWAISTPVNLGGVLHQLLLLGFAAGMYVLALLGIRSTKDLVRVLWLIVLSSFLSSILWYLHSGGVGFYRATGFFRNPNHFAFMLAISVLISSYFLLARKRNLGVSVFLLANILICIALLFLSGSRSILLTALPALVLLLFRYVTQPGRGAGNRMALGVGIAALITIAVFSIIDGDLLSSRLMDRFDAENLKTASGRLDLWRAGLLAAEDYHLTGMGIGQYLHNHQTYVQQLSGAVYITILEFNLGLHNEYLTLLVEFGLLGLGIYVVAVVTIWRGIRRFSKANPRHMFLASLAECCLVLDVVFSASQDMYLFPYHWLILGTCVSLLKIGRVAPAQTRPIKPILTTDFRPETDTVWAGPQNV